LRINIGRCFFRPYSPREEKENTRNSDKHAFQDT
jgi:hypothetical protein